MNTTFLSSSPTGSLSEALLSSSVALGSAGSTGPASPADSVLMAADIEMKTFSEPSWFAVIVIAILALTAAFFILVSAIAMYLAPDALSQVNMLGPAVGVGMPLLIMANLIYSWSTEGFILADLIKALCAIAAFLIVATAGSYIMGRAIHATQWDHTAPLSGGKKEKSS